jgi:hypothetical protein
MSIRKFRAARVTTTTGNTYVGQHGDVFYDESTGLMRVSDGVTPGGHFIPVNPATTTVIGGIIAGPGANVSTSGLLTINTAGLSFSFGDFYATGGNISTVNTNEDFNILTNGTGNVNIIGNLRLYATGTGQFSYGNTPLLSVANSGNLLINGNVITNGNTTVNGSYAFNGPTVHTGNLTTNGNLITNGSSYFNGPEFNVGNVTVTGNLINNGTTYNTGLLYQVGDSTVTGNLTINGLTTFNGPTVRNGNITTNGNLFVFGATTNNGTTYNNGVQYQNGNLFVTGNTTFTVTLTSSNQGGVEITGNAGGLYQTPINPGVTLHTTGPDTGSQSGRVYFDSVNNYSVIAGRRYNGTIANPTQILAGQDIVRIAGSPYTSAGWPTVGPARMSFTAGDTMTGTAQGGYIQFWTTANGNPVSSIAMTATVDPAIGVWATGFQTAGNVTAGNITASGNIFTTGNVTGNYITANNVGSTGNINIQTGSNYWTFATNGGLYGTGVVWAGGAVFTGNLSAGNVISNNYLFANGVSVYNTLTSNYQAGDAYLQGEITAANVNIATLQTQVYANANVAAYLPTYTGNISAGNISITNNETVGGSVTVTGNVTAGAFVNTVTTVSVVSNAYTLDFSTCPNMLILNNGTTAFTITMVNYTPGKRVILSTPGIGGAKITVTGLTTTNSFNNTNQYSGLNGPTGAAVVELICTTNAASGVYLSDIVAK